MEMELSKRILFEFQKKRQCFTGHLINLATNAFLYNQDPKDIERPYFAETMRSNRQAA